MAINGKTVYPVYRANRDVRSAVRMGAFSPNKKIQFKKVTGNRYCAVAE